MDEFIKAIKDINENTIKNCIFGEDIEIERILNQKFRKLFFRPKKNIFKQFIET